MSHVEIKSRVGADGILALTIPLGQAQANREVKITVEAVDERAGEGHERWVRFVDEVSGAWQGEGLVRPEQGDFESRLPWA